MEKVKGNLIYMFPGVGSQYHGMGKELYDRYDKVKEIYLIANEVTGINFYDLCFGNDVTKIKENAYAQQALVCLCYSIYHVFQEEMNLTPDFLMGYSLGEYSALACSGIISFEDALYVVKQRAKIIDEVSEKQDGTMVWCLNVPRKRVDAIVEQLRDQDEKLYVSAYEGKEKVSVSGTNKSIKVLAEQIECENGMIVPVKMSGPFHSLLMKEAEIELRKVLEKIIFSPARKKTIANYNAQIYTDDRTKIIENLSKQLTSPVLWQQSMLEARKGLQNIAVELGPKNVLQYIYKLNFPEDPCFTVERKDDIREISRAIKNSKIKYREVIKKCLGLTVALPNRCEDPSFYQSNVVEEYVKLMQFYIESEDRHIDGNSMIRELKRTYRILQAKGADVEEIEKRLKIITSKIMLIGE